MATNSKLPSDHGLSKTMQAYIQNIESRKPSSTTQLDTGTTTLAQLIAAYNQLIQDLNK